MKILFVADEVSKLKPKGDSSLALARAAISLGHEVHWTTETGLGLRKFETVATTFRCEAFTIDTLPELTDEKTRFIRDFNAVLIRKDPPFDESYLKLCWLLTPLEEKIFMLNRPSILLRNHEKMIPFEAVAAGMLSEEDVIPTFISDPEGTRAFLAKDKVRAVHKPFLGFGGNDVKLVESSKDLDRVLANPGRELIQPFQEEIVHGDRRVLFLNGEVIGHFVRMPPPKSFLSNLAQGGNAVSRPLDSIEDRLMRKLGLFLKHAHIDFAGADVIGHKISEVNITSPTGIRSVQALEGRDVSTEIIKFCEKRYFR